MKTKILLLSLVTMLADTASWADVNIDETNFPDANFRNYLLTQSYGRNGVQTRPPTCLTASIQKVAG